MENRAIRHIWNKLDNAALEKLSSSQKICFKNKFSFFYHYILLFYYTNKYNKMWGIMCD
jgi:hypothetical protein